MPFLTGGNKGNPHETIYLRKFDQGTFAVRHGNDKLVISKTGAEPMLFNLKTDIGETRNLAKEEPQKLAKIEKLRADWSTQLIEPVFEGLKSEHGPKKKK